MNINNLPIIPYLIPTEDVSNLGLNPKDIHGKPRLYLSDYPVHHEKQHLYLTSDREIKEGNYFIDPKDLTRVCKSYGKDTSSEMIKRGLRVEFTNDKFAIEDGVLPLPKWGWLEKPDEPEKLLPIPFLQAFVSRHNSKDNQKPKVSDMKEGEMLEILKRINQKQSTNVKGVDVGITEKDFIKTIKESSDYVNVDMAPVFEDEWFAVGHNCLILAQSMVAKSQSNSRGYSLDDIKETLRIGVNIGMQNLEKPRHENDFNFNQEKAISECKKYIQSLTEEQPKRIFTLEDIKLAINKSYDEGLIKYSDKGIARTRSLFIKELIQSLTQEDPYPEGHCQSEEEMQDRCDKRCDHCIEYYKPLDKEQDEYMKEHPPFGGPYPKTQQEIVMYIEMEDYTPEPNGSINDYLYIKRIKLDKDGQPIIHFKA